MKPRLKPKNQIWEVRLESKTLKKKVEKTKILTCSPTITFGVKKWAKSFKQMSFHNFFFELNLKSHIRQDCFYTESFQKKRQKSKNFPGR